MHFFIQRTHVGFFQLLEQDLEKNYKGEKVYSSQLSSCHDYWNSTFFQSLKHTNRDDRLDA